jgi:hypothetical protein
MSGRTKKYTTAAKSTHFSVTRVDLNPLIIAMP